MQDGLTCYENAWFDASATQRQILRFRERRDPAST